MSYRRSAPTEREKWLETHKRALIVLGVPEAVVADYWRFVSAIEEGEDHETNWHIGWIDPANFEDLHRLLIERFSADDSYLISDLEARLLLSKH
ncbi:hypothetical protein SAMN04488030_2043 [Aliiroseovarius halocynthiae]|uniref:Uncharacterized protein n=1 Tax=Aliiroseovarius halocynthiae TaxID=985055 RepID=A0A545SRE4_9RHOB|nr:hypothetical protein [Aliiroseovarius halocynthiae]TQV67558.1 hypothetical protein FIL88_10080 [Aliiroseovarius halocynthiae]SMR81573.1 hypothetical protein SAMN04488030_2043 [Aliiroseovarius halocynthiae]